MKRLLLVSVVFLMTLLQVKVYSPPTWKSEADLEEYLRKELVFDFSNSNAAPGSSADKAKALYYYVAGPSSNGYPSGFNGPSRGLFGVIGDILEHRSMKRVFKRHGVTSCDLIPTSGSLSVNEHSEGQLTLHFFPGRELIPNHFAVNPGTPFAKRIQVDGPRGHIISVEMNCEENSVRSGYMVMEKNRRIELYYQFNSSTNEQQMDAYMDYPTSMGNAFNEKMALRFESDDSEKFRFWGVRTTDDSDEGSLGVAVEGDAGQDHAQIRVVEDNDDTPDTATDLSAGTPECISLVSNSTTTGCTNVSAPVATVHGNTFDLPGTDAIPVETIEILRTDVPIYDFGSHAAGSSINTTITVTNVGSTDALAISASGLAAPFDFSGGSFPGTGGTCVSSLAAGSSCTVQVDFDPTAAGSYTDQLIFTYTMNGLSYDTTVDFLGIGTAGGGLPSPAVLTISESDPYNYSSHNTGSSSDHSFTISNSGGASASGVAGSGLASPFSFKGGSYPGTGGTCSSLISAGASCTVVVNYSPLTTGVHSDTIAISYNDGVTTQVSSRNIQGTGTSPSLATLVISDGPTYDYGSISIGNNSSHTFTVTNSGSATATSMSESGLATPYMFAGGSYPGTSGTCGASLAAAGSCTLDIQYIPVAAGVQNDTIDLSYNDGASTQSATRNVAGTGITPASLSISEADPYDYGTHATGAISSHIFTITNSGASTATAISETGLASPFSFTGGSFPGTSGTCTTTLTAGSNCNIEIEFGPVATGVATDTINISYNDGSTTQSATRNIQGTAATPALLVISESDPYDYGSVSTGSNQSHTFTVTNTGGVTAISLSGSGLAAPYSFFGGAYPGVGGTCGATLAAGANCTVDIDFAPISTGVQNDTFNLNYNDGASAQMSSRNITGTGI